MSPAARTCPAILISAPASHQGKTTITAGLARLYTRRGLKVHVFKVGPDFLDPMILEFASCNPVKHLDLWMVGKEECQRLLYEAAESADLIIVEGVMGLFDGAPSTADTAIAFQLPVAAIIDVTGMAESAAAIAYGLSTYKSELKFLGYVANKVASNRHLQMVQGAEENRAPFLGAIYREEAMAIPSRHLGLHLASEIVDLAQKLDAVADALEKTDLGTPPPVCSFLPPASSHRNAQRINTRIAIAQDDAFAFVYEDNIRLLVEMGARIEYFSPLTDEILPDADCIYLPGGYPELHLQTLSQNYSLIDALHRHAEAGKSIYAECGGLLYLLESLTDKDGNSAEMCGLLPGHAVLEKRLMGLGLQFLDLPTGTLRGHTFHHSRIATRMEPVATAKKMHDGSKGENLYRKGNIWGTYFHAYFPSAPATMAAILTNKDVF